MPNAQARRWRAFLWILEWPSALGLGTLAAFLFSLKQVNPEVRFVWNGWSLLVLAAATIVSWLILRTVLRVGGQDSADLDTGMAEKQTKSRRVRMTCFVILLAGGTVASFLYALRDISTAKRLDVAVGTGSAFLFVAVALYGFWRLVRFLERHGVPEEELDNDKPVRGGDGKDTS